MIKIYLCRKLTAYSLKTIEDQFGSGDSAVAQSYSRSRKEINADRRLKCQVAEIEKRFAMWIVEPWTLWPSCFIAVRELGTTASELARQMRLFQPAISISVKHGERIVKEKILCVDDFLAWLIYWWTSRRPHIPPLCSRWSKSIAVGSIKFAERMKTAMGAMARDRTIRGI